MSPDEYTALLREAERLTALDPEPMSTDAGNLLALTQRIEDYESGKWAGAAELMNFRLHDLRRIDALEKAEHNGASPTLINDDNGHWAVACDGMQPIEVDGGKFQAEVIMQTFVEPQMWKGSIREAIDFWIESEAKAQAADNG